MFDQLIQVREAAEHNIPLLAVGCWLLAFGFWLLAFGFWLLALGAVHLLRRSTPAKPTTLTTESKEKRAVSW
ncbi:hypothetical protein [Endozoicomonas euniceicola]|uniref:Uncharacterized protein n=1 Tax=Endozoicomonas euniceicola TaxID=1234143 RepID=A0ABY6GR60_9GAMM|nr:hypothetical protein [Endozoicomonas euniceicola]UYM14578.1 hypothetical protein NX720_16990 [Endozoicomonas euniceicola]